MNKEYLSRNQLFSSLVLNTPYVVDSFTTSPKIAKLLSLPFGIRISSTVLLKLVFNAITSSVTLMAIACVTFCLISTPIEKENMALLVNTKSLTNKQFILLSQVQETVTYEKLFRNAKILSLEEPQEIIHLKNNEDYTNISSQTICINKYPRLQFTGF